MRFLLFGFFCLGCGGQTLASGSDASSDASPTQDAASDSSIPDASFRSSLSFGNGASGGSFFGEFFATAQQVNGCQTTTMGACVVAVCPNVGPQTLPNAGTLTI